MFSCEGTPVCLDLVRYVHHGGLTNLTCKVNFLKVKDLFASMSSPLPPLLFHCNAKPSAVICSVTNASQL